MNERKISYQKTLILAFFASFLFHTLLAYWFPITQDEAYYFYWSRFPDLGYFDHPPMIAWLASLGPMLGLGDSVFSYRFGGLMTATVFFPLSISLFHKLGMTRGRSILTAVVLLHFNIAALVFGFINTPDLPLTLFWLLALHEGVAAMKGQPYRWLTAGIATGLGIQSKYSMILIGLVFLYGLWRSRGGLKSFWPYLGGVACVLVLSPHLWWNAQHDWISFRFQLGRGFLSKYDVKTQLAAQLPEPEKATPGSPEYQLSHYFKLPDKVEKPRKPRAEWERMLSRVGSFIGGQIGLWGLMAFVLGWQFFRRRKASQPQETSTPMPPIIMASIAVPLIVFGLISPFQNIEANWPAVYLIGAAAWLGSQTWIRWPALTIAALLNILLTSLLLWHSHSPLNSKRPAKDRILRETHGYQDLSQLIQDLDGPVFADSYQTVSMLNFYQSEKQIAQWPGVSRISELVRRQEMVPYQWHDLLEHGAFYLLTEQFTPPIFTPFQAVKLWQLLDCLDGTFAVQEAQLLGSELPACKTYVHRWTLVRYSSEPSMVSPSPPL
ncbi:MAG: ArnT family glycosyltransferase [Oligoflexus sp.]